VPDSPNPGGPLVACKTSNDHEARVASNDTDRLGIDEPEDRIQPYLPCSGEVRVAI